MSASLKLLAMISGVVRIAAFTLRSASRRCSIPLTTAGISFLLAGCGNPEQQALERMVRDRVGPKGLSAISDVVVYRDGDMKRACLEVRRRNNWGEELPPEHVYAWYVFNTESWHFDNFHPIEDGQTCTDKSKETAADRARADQEQTEAMNRQLSEAASGSEQWQPADSRQGAEASSPSDVHEVFPTATDEQVQPSRNEGAADSPPTVAEENRM